MIATLLVTVLVDGTPVEGSTSACLCDDVVMAPVAPYLDAFADRIQVDERRRVIVIARGGRSISIAIPIAPYLRAEQPVIPLAAVARALGADVSFDATSKTLSISWIPQPLVSATPDGRYIAPAQPLGTFTPQPTPAPPVVVTSVPRPRRTPITVRPGP